MDAHDSFQRTFEQGRAEAMEIALAALIRCLPIDVQDDFKAELHRLLPAFGREPVAPLGSEDFQRGQEFATASVLRRLLG